MLTDTEDSSSFSEPFNLSQRPRNMSFVKIRSNQNIIVPLDNDDDDDNTFGKNDIVATQEVGLIDLDAEIETTRRKCMERRQQLRTERRSKRRTPKRVIKNLLNQR
mmetsp:Transcript_11405/g.13792  ORF Transcript_11405/g.13792 Transcript_11405/m.13792 type:complete len:106 (+) Transcript_11405:92-409(+)